MASTTSAANDAAERGDWPACLAALLELWRDQPAFELARLIDDVAARCNAPECAPTAAAIKKRIASATDADITPILATIIRQARVMPNIARHAYALAASRRPDPRIAATLSHFLEHYPYAHADGALDRELVDGLVAMNDPRYWGQLRMAAKEWEPRRGRYVRRRLPIDHIVEVAKNLVDRPVAPYLDRTIAHILDRTKPDTRNVVALLDAVYADLASDAPRAIYADALQDAGNPRGEFITLQLTNPGTRREKQLQRANERAWLGPLDKAVQKSGLVWRRGFPATAKLAWRSMKQLSPSDRGWHTLEEIDVGEAWGEDLIAWLATLPQLRKVERLRCNELMAARTPLPWTHLKPRAGRGLTSAFSRFTALEELDLSLLSLPEGRAIVDAIQRPDLKTILART